jgi:hypothetical protein
MVSVVIASNYLVQFPVNEWLTYGTLSYPLAFLITNVTNRCATLPRLPHQPCVGFGRGRALAKGTKV